MFENLSSKMCVLETTAQCVKRQNAQLIEKRLQKRKMKKKDP